MEWSNLDVKPPEEIRGAFFDRGQAWEPWGGGWLCRKGGKLAAEEKSGGRAGGDCALLLKLLPGTPAQAEKFVEWWNRSRQKGCTMLPPLQKAVGRDDFWFAQEDRQWFCLQLPHDLPVPLKGAADDRPLEGWYGAAAALAKLHSWSHPWLVGSGQDSGAYWVRLLQERLGELLLYRGILRRRGCRTDFEGLFMENFDGQYRRGQEALNSLVLALQPKDGGKIKGWALSGCSPGELLWQNKENLFLSLWPYPSFDMMDLSLLLKTALQSAALGEEGLRLLLQAYQSERRLDPEDLQMLRAQWLFPEGFWFHARRYFLMQQPEDPEVAFRFLGASLRKETGLQQLLSRQVKSWEGE